jgi:glycerophosphoryl diester phosphodiesterase
VEETVVVNQVARMVGREVGALPLVLGHRGSSACAPENTIAAFRRAIDDGADGVELDVQLTSDGVAVVVHDRTLRRTTGHRPRVSSTSSTRLAELDCGSWFDARYAGERVPTLHEALELLAPRMLVNVELKGTREERLVDETVAVIRSAGAADAVLLSSFDHRLVRRARDIAPEIARATLMHPLDVGMPSRTARRLGAIAVVMARRQLTRARVDHAHGHGLAVVVYTVDRRRDIEQCLRLGVDVIISNDPAATREAITPVV